MNRRCFNDLFNFEKKSKLKASEGLSTGKHPFFTSSNVVSKYTNHPDQFYDTALIFGTGGSASIHYCAEPFSASTDCFVVTPKENLCPKFVYYYLSGHIHILEEGFKGAGLKHISKKYIQSLNIPLPPLEEQKKIAAILDAADALRQKDAQLIEKYNALSQSLFLDMFGDPVTNPMGWDVKILKSIGSISTGNTPPRANPKYYGGYIEWVKTNNINTPNMYLTKAEEHLSLDGLNVGRSVEKGSLLVTCIAGSKKVIGNVAIADRKVAFNQQINSFTPDAGNPLFFYNMFIIGQKHIQSFSTNGMKGMISKSKFESIDFISPPVDKQNQFTERIQAIEAQKQQAQAALQKSEALFNSLLKRAFKGELTA